MEPVTPDPLFDLTDRVVVVTGGLGQLGRSYAKALRERGARVAILDLRAEPAEAERVLTIPADVADRSSLERALATIEAAWGTPYGLVNNAALDSPPNAPAGENGPFEEYPESSWDRVIEVNVKGVFLCCQVFGGAMARVGEGSIVNIGSIYGLVSPVQDIYEYRRERGETFFKPAAYATSKSALLNLTRYLATYWARKGVRVNNLTLAGVFNDQEEAFLEAYQERMPIGRMAREDEYDGAVLFLLSRASSYMTGANLVVDGGWTAW
ncbi:MAG: SDR family oxidoreductase [Fimbriimonadaceae bacterium]|nr:SDR family oxidoreductase [Fimbriimonadaceae bacterium]